MRETGDLARNRQDWWLFSQFSTFFWLEEFPGRPGGAELGDPFPSRCVLSAHGGPATRDNCGGPGNGGENFFPTA